MAVSKKKKIIIASVVILALAGIIGASVFARRTDAPEVQVAKVEKRGLLESKVTANGEVRPIQFINLTAEVGGRVTDVYVKEGDQVRKGTPLVRVDPFQQQSATSVQEAAVDANKAEVKNQAESISVAKNAINTAQAALSTAEADVARSNADLTRANVEAANAQIEFQRNAELVEAKIISRSVFDSAKARLDTAQAAVRASEAALKAAESRVRQAQAQIEETNLRVRQAEAARDSAEARVKQSSANLRSQQDLLRKTTQYATINGVIVGPLVQVGTFALSNFSSTPLMIIADMSVINVEVRVDETDIANVKNGQKVKVKVDALGDLQVEGEVVEIAQSAVTRTGESIATTALKQSQEAKDFKVVVRVTDNRQDVRDRLRPGMSATATIYTDKRENIVAVPLQALVERDSSDLKGDTKGAAPAQGQPKDKKPVKGVFTLDGNKVVFTKVETGITGDNDIEITSGLTEGKEIVTGPYRQLRGLKDGTTIKREDKNKKSAGTEEKK